MRSSPSPPGPAAAGPRPDAANLVLIGPMGAGKSSVARELARLTGHRFVDTDQSVRREQGMEVAEIFAQRGEDFFRDRETAALAALRPDSRLVVATGGGIVARPRNRALLRALGRVVWLTAREEVLFARVARHDRRPLLRTADPRATLRELLRAREAWYRECAHLQVDTSDLPHAGVAAQILRRAWPDAPGETAS